MFVSAWKCLRCGHTQASPDSDVQRTGKAVARSLRPGGVRVVDTWTDEVLAEVGRLVGETIDLSVWDPAALSDLVQVVFAATCDRDSDGSEFQIDRDPVCQRCGSEETFLMAQSSTNEVGDASIPVVTHRCWQALNDVERQQQVEQIVMRYAADSADIDEPRDPPPSTPETDGGEIWGWLALLVIVVAPAILAIGLMLTWVVRNLMK